MLDEIVIDVIDETIMSMVHDRASISEMAGQVKRSKGGIQLRLDKLIGGGYLLPPPRPGLARSYRLTMKGIDYLRSKGYI